MERGKIGLYSAVLEQRSWKSRTAGAPVDRPGSTEGVRGTMRASLRCFCPGLEVAPWTAIVQPVRKAPKRTFVVARCS